MKLIEITYSIGASDHKTEIEFDDDASDDDIDEDVKDFVMERLEWSWRSVSPK